MTLLDELAEQTAREKIPYHVLIELTYGCNLRCVMCYNPTHEAKDELTLAEFETLFDDLADMGTMQLTLTGGEVLARPDFWAIGKAARARHFGLRLFSNGTRITPAVAAQFAELAPISVEVSLYGATPETHDAVTARPGSFVKTLDGIRNLRDAGVNVVVKTLLTEINKHEVGITIDLIEELGVKFKGFDPMVFAGHGGDTAPLVLKIPAAEAARLVPFHLFLDEDLACGDDSPMCGAANDFASITPHGLVYPCISMRIPMGNVREQSFKEIWTNPPDPIINDVRNATWGSLKACSGCDARGLCQRCPGLAYHEDGDVLGASSSGCEQAFARLDHLNEVNVQLGPTRNT